MKEQLISFETAELAKEIGFTEPTYNHYTEDGVCTPNSPIAGYGKDGEEIVWDKTVVRLRDRNFGRAAGGACNAPTQELFHKWLREEYKYAIIPIKDGKYYAVMIMHEGVYLYHGEYVINRWGEFILEHTYEDALEKGLNHAAELVCRKIMKELKQKK